MQLQFHGRVDADADLDAVLDERRLPGRTVLAGFGVGSVHLLTTKKEQALRALIARNGGEKIDPDEW